MIILKPKEQRLLKVEIPFIDEISGWCLKLNFTWNLAILDIMNSSSKIVILSPKEAIGILYLRSLGYYKNTARDTTAKSE